MSDYTYKQIEKINNRYSYEVIVQYSYYAPLEEKAYVDEAKKVKMPGFRPGKVPRELINKDISSKVFTSSINALLPEIAFSILTEEKLNPLANLDYSLKEFDKEKGIVFTFSLYNTPEIDSAKLDTIKIDLPKLEVSDEEVDEVIVNMLNQINKDKKTKNPEAELEDKSLEKVLKEEDKKNTKVKITDEMVKSLGYEDATTYEQLKLKIKDSLLKFKQQQSDSEISQKVITEALKIIDFDLPEEMIQTESERQEEEFRNRLNKIKLNQDSYLKTQGTTLENLREEWKKESKNQIKSDIMLINLAVQEKLVPTEDEINIEIQKITDPKVRVQYKDIKNRDYLRTILTRDRGLNKLMQIVKK